MIRWVRIVTNGAEKLKNFNSEQNYIYLNSYFAQIFILADPSLDLSRFKPYGRDFG